MDNYLTLKQASETTGKSERQIRRLCNEPKNKEYIQRDEKGRLLLKIDFLQQNYPLVHVPNDNNKAIHEVDSVTEDGYPQLPDDRDFKIALLEQELRHKEDLSAEKDKRIEVLERSLLLLDQARPVITPQIQEPEIEVTKRKKFLGLF
ncbi:hypothetical protein GJU39_22890 [Pedobacter petrophilus]|uniref:DNA-binding protein n=1 Tax=Pedobacter petrophilus TaxID=1908241 RepID=A0A7K0G7F5_9SPHI|nr:hypothetical protein [Pedobacter petrophilus]MRX78916.1 hypothetical protein [Pedobacter petrophilus]